MNKKIVLITGASSGIGKATAEKLLSDGHIVYAAARRVEQMEDIKSKGAKVLFLDISKNESITNVVNEIINEQGKIDVLFNNAGFALYGSVEETPLDDARYQFEVNLFGLARLTQLITPYMRKQNSGTIINTSSMGGRIYIPLGAWYHATKHALEGFSDCLRLELQSHGINVVVVQPGMIETEFGTVLADPLIKTSGSGPYKPMVDGLAKTAEAGIKYSPATVIADVVSKIVCSKKPKTRYVAGNGAKLMMFIRKWFGDRVFDKFIMKAFG